MWRLFHWGPLIALTIIKCISFTTLYFFGQWCALLSSWLSITNYAIYYTFIVIVSYNFLSAIFIGPGYVPNGWRPKDKSKEKYLQYCHQCEAFKSPRSHHCSKCKKCILKMDHHCPWINNCCGYRNQKHFLYFLLFAVIGSLHSLVLLSITVYRALNFIPNASNKYIYLSLHGFFFILVSIGMSFGVIIAVGSLLYLQLKILFRNKTSIEEWIEKKALMRQRSSKFIYPYNLGIWKNIKQVLCQPISDGITWDVVQSCDQYTLTYEQLEQKMEKQRNSSLYRIVSPYNGRFFPLFSQGFRVCLSFPINDDPRLVLNVGDEVLVTHCHKRWLYGQKQTNNPKVRLKGWFPARCSVVLVTPQYTLHNVPDGDNKKLE